MENNGLEVGGDLISVHKDSTPKDDMRNRVYLHEGISSVEVQREKLKRLYGDFSFLRNQIDDHFVSKCYLVTPNLKTFSVCYAEGVNKVVKLLQEKLEDNFINHTLGDVGPNLGQYLHCDPLKSKFLKAVEKSKDKNFRYFKAQLGIGSAYKGFPINFLEMLPGEAGLGIWEVGNIILTHLDYFKSLKGVSGIGCPGDYASGYGKKHPYFVIENGIINLQLILPNYSTPFYGAGTFIV